MQIFLLKTDLVNESEKLSGKEKPQKLGTGTPDYMRHSRNRKEVTLMKTNKEAVIALLVAIVKLVYLKLELIR